MKDWQFNVLFFVGVGGAIFLLIGPSIGMDVLGKNPTAAGGVGAILAYILAQKRSNSKKDDEPKQDPKQEPPKKEVDDG